MLHKISEKYKSNKGKEKKEEDDKDMEVLDKDVYWTNDNK